jgi:hypothetical protein
MIEEKVRMIVSGGKQMDLYPNGNIGQKNMSPSGQWRIIGAVTRNNFGHITRRYSLDDILSDPGSIPWQFKNGKQKTFLLDFDYGHTREWRSPNHRVF